MLLPDVILATGDSTVPPLLQATRTVPIVFPVANDPVAAGYVDSLALRGGNVTGFMNFEHSFSGKWLELLKEIAPDGKTRGDIWDTVANVTGLAQLGVIQAMAFFVEGGGEPDHLLDAGEIERAVAAFARMPNGGLILTACLEGGSHGLQKSDAAIRPGAVYLGAERDHTILGCKRVMVLDYPDGRFAIRHNGVDLPYRTFDKRPQVNQADIVENKRLGPVLAYIAEKQKELDMSRSAKAPRRRGQRNHMFKAG